MRIARASIAYPIYLATSFVSVLSRYSKIQTVDIDLYMLTLSLYIVDSGVGKNYTERLWTLLCRYTDDSFTPTVNLY